MTTVYTFFDNSSASSLPATPTAAAFFDRSRWSDTTASTRPTLSKRRSLPELRIATSTSCEASDSNTPISDGSQSTPRQSSPLCHDPHSTPSSPLGNGNAQACGQWIELIKDHPAFIKHKTSNASFGTLDTDNDDVPPSRGSEVRSWELDVDASPVSSTFMSPGLTSVSPSLASTCSDSIRTPSPVMVHYQPKRDGMVVSTPVYSEAMALRSHPVARLTIPTSIPTPTEYGGSYSPSSRHRAFSAPSPVPGYRSPGQHFSFYNEARRVNEQSKSYPPPDIRKVDKEKKWWGGLKSWFKKSEDVMSPEEIQIRHWSDA